MERLRRFAAGNGLQRVSISATQIELARCPQAVLIIRQRLTAIECVVIDRYASNSKGALVECAAAHPHRSGECCCLHPPFLIHLPDSVLALFCPRRTIGLQPIGLAEQHRPLAGRDRGVGRKQAAIRSIGDSMIRQIQDAFRIGRVRRNIFKVRRSRRSGDRQQHSQQNRRAKYSQFLSHSFLLPKKGQRLCAGPFRQSA